MGDSPKPQGYRPYFTKCAHSTLKWRSVPKSLVAPSCCTSKRLSDNAKRRAQPCMTQLCNSGFSATLCASLERGVCAQGLLSKVSARGETAARSAAEAARNETVRRARSREPMWHLQTDQHTCIDRQVFYAAQVTQCHVQRPEIHQSVQDGLSPSNLCRIA